MGNPPYLDHSDPHWVKPFGLGSHSHEEVVEVHDGMNGEVDAHKVESGSKSNVTEP